MTDRRLPIEYTAEVWNPASNPEESQWVHDASHGDLDAFNFLVLKYQDLVFNLSYNLLGDGCSAEDAVQDGFIKAFQKIDRFQGSSFRAWIIKIAINTCYDKMRWLKRHPSIPLVGEDDEYEKIEPLPQPGDHNRSVQVLVERKELSALLTGLLNELPEMYRNPIVLIDLLDLDYLEAADVLAIPIGTLKSRLSRARHRMKKKLNHHQ